jgi:Amino acid synthesis
VGVAGEMEHGGACVHPMLGKPMRGAIGGGKAVISWNVKVAAAGASLDVPLGHEDNT